MSEEKAEYATVRGTMRTALENIKKHNDNFALLPENIKIQIDDALAMGSPEPDLYSPMQVQRMIREAYDEGKTEQEIETASKLIELPEQIKTQSLKIAELTNDAEALRVSLANTKNEALELILSATVDGKPKFSNDKARSVAMEVILRENLLYLDTVDGLSRKECELRKEQIQLDYLENTFLAYRAISGLREMR